MAQHDPSIFVFGQWQLHGKVLNEVAMTILTIAIFCPLVDSWTLYLLPEVPRGTHTLLFLGLHHKPLCKTWYYVALSKQSSRWFTSICQEDLSLHVSVIVRLVHEMRHVSENCFLPSFNLSHRIWILLPHTSQANVSTALPWNFLFMGVIQPSIALLPIKLGFSYILCPFPCSSILPS